MKNKRKYFIILSLVLFFVACTKVPLTGRKQLTLLPNSSMMSMSLAAYTDFLKANPPLPSSNPTTQQVQQVGRKISLAVDKYMKENGYKDRLSGYKWEFNAVENKEVNAWCMPGGKVVVYSGIIPVTKDEAGLAVVMGHEIAHAIAEHGNERMTEQLAVALGGLSLDIALQKQPQQTRDLFLLSYGVGTTLGSLAFSRQHELEADRMGLIFIAMAGYDPEVALRFWTDMAKQSGPKPPAFLSTHPSDANRIAKIKKYLPEAKKYYKP